jgi:hypothetical protein
MGSAECPAAATAQDLGSLVHIFRPALDIPALCKKYLLSALAIGVTAAKMQINHLARPCHFSLPLTGVGEFRKNLSPSKRRV